jgi:hypothetical protein
MKARSFAHYRYFNCTFVKLLTLLVAFSFAETSAAAAAAAALVVDVSSMSHKHPLM